MKTGGNGHTAIHPYNVKELGRAFGKKSANNAASQTFPTFRWRLKQLLAFDKANHTSKFVTLLALVSREVDEEMQRSFEEQLPERIRRQTGGRVTAK